jgi:putative ABC transport system permease protein
MIVDASLGLEIGESSSWPASRIAWSGSPRTRSPRVGDSVAFMNVADAQLIALDQPAKAAVLERQRVVERLRHTDLGRGQPGLEELAVDPRWRAPALAVAAGRRGPARGRPASPCRGARRHPGWGDVSVYSQAEEEELLLGGVVQRARMQIGLFTVILTLTGAVIVMMVMYNLTLEKTHDLAVLKLMGAPRRACSAWCCSKPGCWARSATPSRSCSGSWPIPVPAARAHHGDHLAAGAARHHGHRHARQPARRRHVMRVDPARALEG